MIRINLAISQLTNTQKTACQTAAPIFKEWLRRSLRVYRRLNDVQKARFLLKNPVLANIIDAVMEAID